MNRLEYMTELESHLRDISEEDRRDAIEYYNAYFDEAGSENEQKVIEELGDPVKLAEQVREGADTVNENADHDVTHNSYGNNSADYNKTHKSFGDSSADHMSYTYGQSQDTAWNPQTFSVQPGTMDTKKSEDRTWKIVLIVVIALLTSPITVPLILSILGTVFGLILAAVFIVLGLILGAAIVAIVGVVLFGVGISALFSEFFAGLALTGVGLILAAVGAAVTVGMVYLCKLAFPEIARGVSLLWNKISDRRKKGAH